MIRRRGRGTSSRRPRRKGRLAVPGTNGYGSCRTQRHRRRAARRSASAFELPGLRWWMIALVMLGGVLNYLTASRGARWTLNEKDEPE
jgi:hypothetical protein